MDPHKEYKGTKFLFAFYNWKETSWWICNRRFILNEPKTDELFGQFLQSNWFKHKWNKKNDIDFMVIQVAKNDSIHEITKKINNDDFSEIKKFCFTLSKHTHNEFSNTMKNQDTRIVTLVTDTLHATYVHLIIKIIKFSQNNQTDLYLTLPEFLIHI